MTERPGAGIVELRRRLLRWFDGNGRDFWWRHTNDPFTIALVEVLLRQTRADSSAAFLREFTMKYRTPADIVAAGETAISIDLAPIGLHRQRAGQLLALADRLVATPDALNGSTPELMRLPGIGRYAATAISVFAHGRREAVVDVNVVRVFQRVWEIGAQGGELRKNPVMFDLAAQYGRTSRPRVANWALLDLGAQICKPAPRCRECPLNRRCAYAA